MPAMTADPKWYRNPDLLRAAREEYGSLEAAALAIGSPDASTLQRAWRELGLERLPLGPRPKPIANQEALEKLYARVYG